MQLRKKVLTVFSTVLLVQLAACSSDDNEPALQATIEWAACEDEAQLDCATLKVPMDYKRPEGVMIDIALVRSAATGDNKLGSLFFNPGGPGGSGNELVKELALNADTIPESILKAYDLVGFDPRGVGDSTEVDCTEEGVGDLNLYPSTTEDLTQLITDATESSEKCAQKYGDYLQYLGSLNVVRDMDRMRAAVGEKTLNFIGYSYGTRLAALYLQEFPENSGRIILDASVSPDSSTLTLLAGELPLFQSNLLLVLSECKNDDPNCDPNALLSKLTNRIKFLVASDNAEDQREFEFVGDFIVTATTNPEFGIFSSSAIIDYANTSDVIVIENFLLELVNLGLIDSADSLAEDDDNATSGIAVLCADDAARPDVTSLMSALSDFNMASDLFAEGLLPDLGSCAGWPEALEPLAPIVTSTAPTSLVIGGSTDAQTPQAWSKDMAQQIGGVYIGSDHYGHTAVFNDQSRCVDNIAEAFLLEGTLPTIGGQTDISFCK